MSSDLEPTSGPDSGGRYFTIPTGLCIVRLVGSVGLIVLVFKDQPGWFVMGYLILTATDWLDGKLAVWLNQQSTFGARLDSAADAVMYAALLFAALWWKGAVLMGEWLSLGLALGSYVVSCCVAFGKFGQLPSYHTRSAKVSWLLMIIAVLALFWDDRIWPLRLAMLGVTYANLESLAITRLLSEWRADVPSYWHARRLQKPKSPGGTL